MTEALCRWLVSVLAPLVDEPNEIRAEATTLAGGAVFVVVRVGLGDEGRLIGGHGRALAALQELAGRWGGRHGLRVTVHAPQARRRGSV